MNHINDKIKKLEELIKNLKSSVQSSAVLPSIKQPKLQGIKTPTSQTQIPNVAPQSKKNPVKQAEQIKNKDIKDMKMREAREALNINKSGQWSIEPLAKPKLIENPDSKYHIHQGEHRITSNPVTLREIQERHGGVKRLESAGYRLHPVKAKK